MKDTFERLPSDQRAWLTTRDQRATDSANNNVATAPDAPVEEWPELWRARVGITEERVRFINGWVSHHTGRWDSANQWEGVWEDSYGGLMKIALDQGGTLVVASEVVRGPSANTGELNGVDPTGVSETAFTVPVPNTDEDVEVRLRLVGPALKVGTNGPAYIVGGINTYFEGSYTRTRLLTQEEWLELVRGTDH